MTRREARRASADIGKQCGTGWRKRLQAFSPCRDARSRRRASATCIRVTGRAHPWSRRRSREPRGSNAEGAKKSHREANRPPHIPMMTATAIIVPAEAHAIQNTAVAQHRLSMSAGASPVTTEHRGARYQELVDLAWSDSTRAPRMSVGRVALAAAAHRWKPPAASMRCPVTQCRSPASSAAAAVPISSGKPTRPIAV